jgi:uncharacterized protein (TIGR03067 family)
MAPLVLALALTLAAPAPKKSDEPPPAKLDGDWVVESFEGPKDGAPPETITMRFADGKISISDPSRKGKAEEVDYTADLTKKPATIDIKPKAGGPGGRPDKLVLGIIEVKGDELKICFGKETADRPAEFKADVEKGIMVIHLKRVKPEK